MVVAPSTFEKSCELPASAEEAYAWHARPGAFERLVPPWQKVEVVDRIGSIEPGDRLTLRLRGGPFRATWVAEHRDTVPGERFTDVQLSGPFRCWRHTHQFTAETADTCHLRDSIDFRLPGGALVNTLLGGRVARALERTFTYRHRTTRDDPAMHGAVRDRDRLRVAISGASGLVGGALAALLATGGHEVVRLIRHRREPAADEARWDPGQGLIDRDRLEGMDAVVHLAGENLAAGRWSAERKRRIRTSRVEGTEHLVRSLATLARPPRALLGASAVGYYGLDAGKGVDESSPPGSGFLADVCVAWEAAAAAAAALGCRVALLRLGVVLTPAGGALAKMLLPFRLGAGGVVGSGRQILSWISLDDAIAAIHFVLTQPELDGPINLSSPEAVSQRELTRTLGGLLRRPTLAPLPAPAVRLLFGAMGEETLLASCRARPARLEAAGYRFRHPRLEGALHHLLGC